MIAMEEGHVSIARLFGTQESKHIGRVLSYFIPLSYFIQGF